MKKLVCVLLALLMLLSLCACDKVEDTQKPAGGETTTAPAETENETTAPEQTTAPEETTAPEQTTAPTAHEHDYKSKVTKEATCTEKGVKTYTCACGDSYTKDIKKLDHKYSKATCTAPKTCSVCGKTDGKAAAHTYVSGKCTACGGTQKNYKELTADGYWRAYAVCSEGEMDKLSIRFEGTSGSLNASVYNPESMMLDADCVEIDGKKWYEAGFGYGAEIVSFTEEGNKITVKTLYHGMNEGTLVLERTAGNKLKVKSVSGTVIDEIVTKAIKDQVFEFVAG